MTPDLNQIIREADRVERFAKELRDPAMVPKAALDAVAQLAKIAKDLAAAVKELERTVSLPKRKV
jgi:hypothetical protein